MSGSTGAGRIKSRTDYLKFVGEYKLLLSKYSDFISLEPTGSINSDSSKESFGDIDLIVHLKGNDKKLAKKSLEHWFLSLSEYNLRPFTSSKYNGRRTLNTGEIITIRYFSEEMSYSVQIDNIIALTRAEAKFKKNFLDMPAEKQGLVLGLVKVASIENNIPNMFNKLKIAKVDTIINLKQNEEYCFNLSSKELQLRIVTYIPGTYKEHSREVVWRSMDIDAISKLLHNYDLLGTFEDLLEEAKIKISSARSKKRIPGVFKSMITVKSGEEGTKKGDNKISALEKVEKAFK